MSDFVNLDRVEIEHVNKLGQLLNHDHFLCLVSLLRNKHVLLLIVVLCHHWQQHLIDLVSVGLTLEKSEEHLFEHIG